MSRFGPSIDCDKEEGCGQPFVFVEFCEICRKNFCKECYDEHDCTEESEQ